MSDWHKTPDGWESVPFASLPIGARFIEPTDETSAPWCVKVDATNAHTDYTAPGWMAGFRPDEKVWIKKGAVCATSPH